MEVIQVVKRFGLCGGMEEYVFRLTEELCKRGVKVKVLCETQVTETENEIKVIQLGQSIKKPRWASHIMFSQKVSNWVNKHSNSNEIIHSHERSSCHHVTTIHSTLFNFPRKGLPTFRKYMNEYLEKREMNSNNLKKIVPVSQLIAEQIKEKFPFTKNILSHPIPPGVAKINTSKKKFDIQMPIIGFIGKEWKRKGLLKVIEIWREVTNKYPNTKLCLAGFPKTDDIGLSIEEIKKVELLGFVQNKEVFYSKIDMLLHPAKKEAYGMVIAEACSLGIPVICSKECGAAFHGLDESQSINFSKDVSYWTKKVTLCIKNSCHNSFNHKPFSWNDSVDLYCSLYQF
jgi:UDP-glucose:(heptosyl)LPS alpha-1,3-glucosyltransferase